VDQTFSTQWALYEEDWSSNDDVLNATVEPHPHSAYSPKKVFVPSRANPSNPEEVSFTETRGWHRDDLDTEIGDEELYAGVNIQGVTVDSFNGAKSNQVPLSP
jgi:hypothetical protein